VIDRGAVAERRRRPGEQQARRPDRRRVDDRRPGHPRVARDRPQDRRP